MATFPKLDRPYAPPEVHVILGTLGADAGLQAIERAVHEGITRPFDIAGASIAEPAALYVPFWRVEVALDELHLEVGPVTAPSPRSVPLPTRAARFREVALTIPGRTAFPYAAQLPSLLARAAGGPAPITLEPGEMTVEPDVSTLNGEVLDADVDDQRAEEMAWALVLEATSPLHAIYRTYEPRVRAAAFCLYPVYFARYGYEGEARRRPGEEHFVAISGTTGEVIAAAHPSAVRAVAAKVRRLLSFDRR